jgi:hypothetical protein
MMCIRHKTTYGMMHMRIPENENVILWQHENRIDVLRLPDNAVLRKN